MVLRSFQTAKLLLKEKRKMAKQYAVYHTEKGEISSGGIGNHIDRKEGAEWSYQHADPERIHLNENIIVTEHCSKKLSEAISIEFPRVTMPEIMPEN